MLFERELRLFKALCLLLLPNVPGATFIQGQAQGSTFIPDSRELVKWKEPVDTYIEGEEKKY